MAVVSTATMKKILRISAVLVCALMLSSCSLFSSVFNLLGGMANAITRTVTDTNTPSDKPMTDPTAERGAEIAARGTYLGPLPVISEKTDRTSRTASR